MYHTCIQVTFQLYIKARDFDDGLIIDLPIDTDDDLDDIFINRALEVNTSFTAMEEYTGILNRVSVQMRFRVTCQQDYYGADCSTFCVAQNDDLNGYYTCNSDGSIQCLEDFENPQNNCRDSELNLLDHTVTLQAAYCIQCDNQINPQIQWLRLILMTVCQQSAPTIACVWTELTRMSAFVIPVLSWMLKADVFQYLWEIKVNEWYMILCV